MDFRWSGVLDNQYPIATIPGRHTELPLREGSNMDFTTIAMEAYHLDPPCGSLSGSAGVDPAHPLSSSLRNVEYMPFKSGAGAVAGAASGVASAVNAEQAGVVAVRKIQMGLFCDVIVGFLQSKTRYSRRKKHAQMGMFKQQAVFTNRALIHADGSEGVSRTCTSTVVITTMAGLRLVCYPYHAKAYIRIPIKWMVNQGTIRPRTMNTGTTTLELSTRRETIQSVFGHSSSRCQCGSASKA